MKYVKENDPREAPKDDPRDKSDLKPYPQTNEPWKQNAQHVTDPSLGETPKPDLEKWANQIRIKHSAEANSNDSLENAA